MLQFAIVYLYLCLYTTTSTYYALLYIFLQFFLLGVCLSVFQLELFAAFLWLVECSVIFVFLLFLFYFNVKNMQTKTRKTKNVIALIVFSGILVNFLNQNQLEVLNVGFSIYFVIDNYYESFVNNISNDLFGFFLSYYFLNGFELVVVGLILLFGSVICVILYQITKNTRVQNYNTFLKIFDFFKDFTSFNFLRKQSVVLQNKTKSSLKLFKKK